LTTYIHRGRFVAGNVAHERNGIRFNWDRKKAEINLRKHGVSFDAACEIFFDPLIHLHRSEMLGGEKRETAIGLTEGWQQLAVVYTFREEAIRIISARPVTPGERCSMKMAQLRERLQKERPMTTISIRMPEDVVEDLKRVAPLLGFSGYQPLIRAYIGQGLREDLERLDRNPGLERLVESLRRQGVDEEVISSAMAEMKAT
jgi:uncharacterized DUF497 family protein